jgi:hypothetical protein
MSRPIVKQAEAQEAEIDRIEGLGALIRHCPIVDRGSQQRLGIVSSRWRGQPACEGDDVIDKDFAPLWCETRWVTTGVDVLGRPFEGIAAVGAG